MVPSWQATHARGVFVNVPKTWQFSQATVACENVSGYVVLEWSNTGFSGVSAPGRNEAPGEFCARAGAAHTKTSASAARSVTTVDHSRAVRPRWLVVRPKRRLCRASGRTSGAGRSQTLLPRHLHSPLKNPSSEFPSLASSTVPPRAVGLRQPTRRAALEAAHRRDGAPYATRRPFTQRGDHSPISRISLRAHRADASLKQTYRQMRAGILLRRRNGGLAQTQQ